MKSLDDSRLLRAKSGANDRFPPESANRSQWNRLNYVSGGDRIAHGKTRPYGDVQTGDFDQRLDCAKALDDRNRPAHADWSSPSWLLTALHYCFIHTNVGRKSDELRKELPSPARDAEVKELGEEIDNLGAHAGRLRVASKKAIERMRHSVETHGFWEFLKGW